MKIAIFCGASLGNHPIYKKSTKEIGHWLGTHHHTLVYGGGNVGLMGTVADATLAHGGKAIGIMPTFLAAREIAHTGLSELILVEDMHQRKRQMIDLSECYMALPGGPGTLEEISEVISWGRIGQHQNPCILFNENGYYDKLADFYKHMVAEGFLSAEDEQRILCSNNLDEIQQFIANYQPPCIRQYSSSE